MAKLVLVPTPIGNLEDITLRGLRALRDCEVLFAEDTRTTGHLLSHFEINKKSIPFHLNNEHKKLQSAINLILSTNLSVLVSDAGTPGISDPGFLLVRECIKNKIHIETLPGATAFVPALVNSGLPCDKFFFEGFLPHKKGRETRLRIISEYKETIVLYESPHRLVKLLSEIEKHCGAERYVSVSRELTKKFEETFRGTVIDAINHFSAKTVKGEIVVIISGKI